MFRNREQLSGESGAVPIVEAAFVYPVVIFVVIIFIFLGNVFYQQSRVESVAVRGAERLAAYYSNSLLTTDGLPTNTKNIELDPYRYIFKSGGAKQAAEGKMQEELDKIGTGLFSGMSVTPTIEVCDVKNIIVAPTAKVSIKYSINFYPMKLFGSVMVIEGNAIGTTAAVDPAEFIRNVDMLMDYDAAYGVSNKIKETVGKFLGK